MFEFNFNLWFHVRVTCRCFLLERTNVDTQLEENKTPSIYIYIWRWCLFYLFNYLFIYLLIKRVEALFVQDKTSER